MSTYNRVVAADENASLAPTVRARLATEMADPTSEVGVSLSGTFAPTDLASSSFAHIRAKIERDLTDVNIAVVGDSTGAGTTRWPYLFAQHLAATYPEKTVVLLAWNVGTDSYDAATTIQTGTGARTVTVYNGSASGENTAYSQSYLATMLPATCDLVFINHGHNMTGTDNSIASNKFYALGRSILAWHSRAASLVMIGQNPKSTADSAADDQLTRSVKAAKVAARNGWGYLNVTQLFLDQPSWETLIADGTHPTEAGSILWADYIWGLFSNARTNYATPQAPTTDTERVWIPGHTMLPTIVVDAYPAPAEKVGWPTMEFGNASGSITAIGSAEIPPHWEAVDVWFYWIVGTEGTGGNVGWEIRYSPQTRIGEEIASGSTTTSINNTQTPIAATYEATPGANYGQVHTKVLSNTTLGIAGIDGTTRIVSIWARRLASNAADTYADSAYLLGIMVERAL